MQLRDVAKELKEKMLKSNSSIGDGCKCGSFVIFGEGCRIGNQVTINNFVQIDDGVRIGNNVIIKEFTRIDKNAKIGNRVQIRGHSVICTDAIIEGDNDLGHGLYLVNHVRMNKYKGDDNVSPPIIKKGVRIGARVMLMPGVIIGNNSIIGENSRVRKSIPPNQVWITDDKGEFRFLRKVTKEEALDPHTWSGN